MCQRCNATEVACTAPSVGRTVPEAGCITMDDGYFFPGHGFLNGGSTLLFDIVVMLF